MQKLLDFLTEQGEDEAVSKLQRIITTGEAGFLTPSPTLSLIGKLNGTFYFSQTLEGSQYWYNLSQKYKYSL